MERAATRDMNTSTSSNGESQGAPLLGSLDEALEYMCKTFGNMRKFRYRLHEYAPMQPSISRTKTYEMVIMHPLAFDRFIAQFEMTDTQITFAGLSPATDREWREWAKELGEQMNGAAATEGKEI